MRWRRGVRGLVLAGCVAWCGGRGPARQAAAEPVPDAAAFEQAVRRAGGEDFWGTVLVAREGRVLFSRGFGAADYDRRPNAPDTLFELASASKQVTATAILKLEQQKRLKTTDPLHKFFGRDLPQDKRAITLEHLLHHTAGLDPELGVPYAWQGTRAAYLEQILAAPLVAAPGAAFSYSNVGYALLAAVVEEVTKGEFEDYVRRELFKPAGLVDTGFIGDKALIDSPRVSVRRADDAEPGWTAASWFYGWGYRGMGGVVSTALDLERWDRALRGDKLLGAAARQKLYEPGLERYAYGWMIEPTERGTRKAHHAGGVRGYAVQVARWLEEDALVVVLSNGKSDVHGVERALGALLFPPPRLSLALDAGSLALGGHGQLVREGGAEWRVSKAGGQARLELLVEGHRAADLGAPVGVLTKLVADLESALAASAFPEPDAEAATGVGVFFNLFGRGVRTARLDDGLELRVMPRYRGQGEDGQRVEDLRTVLVVASRQPSGWPILVQMNPKAVRALIEALRKA
jgi:CubicO group peptidase (beta-lactamase class C family)